MRNMVYLAMKRKKWTPQTEVTDDLLRSREKRKWQLALRRYVLEQRPSPYYAPYFGLDVPRFREWIEIQFAEGLAWDNFASHWQFDHIVPVNYFDFSAETDLKLCWNFTNIRVERLESGKSAGDQVDILSAKSYFKSMLSQSFYPPCRQMLEKLEALEQKQAPISAGQQHFLHTNSQYLQEVSGFSTEEFARLNEGTSLEDIILERAILKKFGA